jgi:prepilin-type N-terminal cleavage/methylation domain-containing protein
MGLKRFTSKAFTPIELMLVVAIIGLLAAIALPKFANLVIKAKEASIKGKLGALRSAVTIYYSDNEGRYPDSQFFDICLTNGGRYLDRLPFISVPNLTDHAGDGYGMIESDFIVGHAWLTFSDGIVAVNCTHTDSKGTTWSLW